MPDPKQMEKMAAVPLDWLLTPICRRNTGGLC
ncbi:hypothetical protein ACVWZ4_005344 [Bradyrhizobium sp. USDA 4472]